MGASGDPQYLPGGGVPDETDAYVNSNYVRDTKRHPTCTPSVSAAITNLSQVIEELRALECHRCGARLKQEESSTNGSRAWNTFSARALPSATSTSPTEEQGQ